MIRVAVMYPQSEGKSFNLEYYMNKHMKLVKERLGSLGLVGSEVDVGISCKKRDSKLYIISLNAQDLLKNPALNVEVG